MIVSLHVATGGLVGALAGTRGLALVLGLATHAAGDAVPHQDVASRRFETLSGVAGLALLAAARGPLDPAVVGAVGASVPISSTCFRFHAPEGASSSRATASAAGTRPAGFPPRRSSSPPAS